MSPSSDIETLFGHFGGNAGDYQEIGRESEASSARTRWPLLVTLDLKQPSIPAIAQRRDPPAVQSNESTRAQAPQDDAPATQSTAEVAAAREAGTPRMRTKAPLFARPHRRSVPPVVSAVNADAPRGAARFAPLPAADEDRLAASEAAPAAAAVPEVPPAAVAPLMAAQSAAMPPPAATAAAPVIATPRATATVPPVAGAAPLSWRAPAFAPAPKPVGAAPAPSAAPPATSAFASRFGTPAAAAPAQPRTAFATAWAAAPAAAAPQASQPPSILGKLFAPAARSAPASVQPSVGEAPPPSLNSVFDRLRGAAKAPATPAAAPHSWLTNGPRRS